VLITAARALDVKCMISIATRLCESMIETWHRLLDHRSNAREPDRSWRSSTPLAARIVDSRGSRVTTVQVRCAQGVEVRDRPTAMPSVRSTAAASQELAADGGEALRAARPGRHGQLGRAPNREPTCEALRDSVHPKNVTQA
jgi:hypothetical protein